LCHPATSGRIAVSHPPRIGLRGEKARIKSPAPLFTSRQAHAAPEKDRSAMFKAITAATLLVLLALGMSACTTAQGNATAPSVSTGQSGGGY
jgi:hypothetical protein